MTILLLAYSVILHFVYRYNAGLRVQTSWGKNAPVYFRNNLIKPSSFMVIFGVQMPRTHIANPRICNKTVKKTAQLSAPCFTKQTSCY